MLAGLNLLVFLAGSVAGAAPRVVSLTYVRGAGAAECPDDETVRAGVAARLGYEPFDGRADTRISATIARVGRTMEATLVVTDGAGQVVAERRLSSRGKDCVELTSAVELAISIAIDPVGGGRPRPKAEEPPPPAPAPPAPPPPPAAIVLSDRSPPTITQAPGPVRPAGKPIVFETSVGAVVSMGSAPAPAFGGSIRLALRRGAVSVGLEGRADLPVTAPLRVGDMRTSLLTGSVVPCLHSWIFSGCLLTTAGALRAAGHGLVDERAVTMSFLAIGGRLALELPITRSVLVVLHGDVLAPLTETILRVSNEVVWNSSPLAAAVGLCVGARFP